MATFGSDWSYSITVVNDYEYDSYEIPNHHLSDEEVLERMNIEVIEKFLRKKKLERLEKCQTR